MKQRDDTKPQVVIIDTANLTLEFDDYVLYAMNDKQTQSLEYAKDIIPRKQKRYKSNKPNKRDKKKS